MKPEDLRGYAERNWSLLERLARRERAAHTVEQNVAMAIELYEAARMTSPTWPDERTRQADYEAHRRLKALLDRAPDVGIS